MWKVAFELPKTANGTTAPPYEGKDSEWAVIVLEHLRYADALQVNGFGHTATVPEAISEKFRGKPFAVLSVPKGMNGQVWAHQVTARLRSFDVHAEAYK